MSLQGVAMVAFWADFHGNNFKIFGRFDFYRNTAGIRFSA